MIRREAPHINMVEEVAKNYFKKVIKLQRVTMGSSTYVYRVLADDQVYYLRILPEQNISFAAEVNVLKLLSNNKVSVPKVIHFEEKNDRIGLSLMIVEELLGQDLEGSSNELDHCNIKRILFRAGEQLALVNQVELEGFGEIDRVATMKLTGEHHSMMDYTNQYLEHDISILPSYELQKYEIKAATQGLELGLPLLHSPCSYLAHGDFDVSHIFHYQGAYSGMIDFGDVKASGARYDLGHFKAHDYINGFEALLEGYTNIKQLSEREMIEIDIWALFVTVRRLGMIHGRMRNFYHTHLTHTLKNLVLQLQRLL